MIAQHELTRVGQREISESASPDQWKDRKCGGMNMQPAASVWPSLLTLVILVRAWREKRKSVEFYPTLKATMLERELFI